MFYPGRLICQTNKFHAGGLCYGIALGDWKTVLKMQDVGLWKNGIKGFHVALKACAYRQKKGGDDENASLLAQQRSVLLFFCDP